MALEECGLNLNKSLKELQPHGTIEFPCAAYSSFHTSKSEDDIPWHWHEELEIIYIADGKLEGKTPSLSVSLDKGDILVINSNILHYTHTPNKCLLNSLVFSYRLITGNNDSIYYKKYLNPLISCGGFNSLLIKNNKEINELFNKAFIAIKNDIEDYEFIVRENLSKICLYLYKQFKDELNIEKHIPNIDNLRIRKMLEYIHDNYMNGLSLNDIASIANISERECMRCFKKTIGISPIQYLLKYRIMQGAEILVNDNSKNIIEVSSSVGFDSPSNFTKLFKRFYNCTPKQYRNNHI